MERDGLLCGRVASGSEREHRRLPTSHRPHLSRDRRDSTHRRRPGDLLPRSRRPPRDATTPTSTTATGNSSARRTSTSRRRLRQRQPDQSACRSTETTVYGMRMNELDALLSEQVAYYRAMAPEYLEDAG